MRQAATIDGASEWQIFRDVTLPLLTPGLEAVAIICIILSYNESLFALVMTCRPETQTLPVGIALFQGDGLSEASPPRMEVCPVVEQRVVIEVAGIMFVPLWPQWPTESPYEVFEGSSMDEHRATQAVTTE